jgi:hypothetical protein
LRGLGTLDLEAMEILETVEILKTGELGELAEMILEWTRLRRCSLTFSFIQVCVSISWRLAKYFKESRTHALIWCSNFILNTTQEEKQNWKGDQDERSVLPHDLSN